MTNCSSTANSITFDLYITNTSTAGEVLKLTGWSVGLNFNSAIKNGSTTFTVARLAGSNDPSINNLYGATEVYAVSTSLNQIQLQVANTNVTCSSSGGNLAASLQLNTPIKLGTYTVTNTGANWTPSSTTSLVFSTSAVAGSR